MKKKTPLIMMLAVLSTAAIGLAACGEVPDPGHDHSYTAWNYNDTNHWKECPDDGVKDTDTEAAHKDTNNDGLCDDGCGYKYSYSVTFNMHDHGTAPAAQKIEHGSKATEPKLAADEISALLDEGWVFDGWYTDTTWETPFNFTETAITSATEVHAHWIAVTPIVLTLGQPTLTKFTSNKLFFSFTASVKGRYTVQLMGSTSCTYTTSATAADNNLVVDGDKYHFSLDKDATVVITVTKPATGWDDNNTVSPVVNECTGEPLPAEGWVAGTYSDWRDEYKLTFTREEPSLTLAAGTTNFTTTYTYIDGVVYFSLTDDVGGGQIQTVDFELRQTGEGEFKLKIGDFGSVILNLEGNVDPIPVSKFSGKYEFESGDELFESVTAIHIYEDGSGYLITEYGINHYGDGEDEGAYYNTEKNVLMWGYSYACVVTLNEAGNAVSITVDYDGERAVFKRTGDAVVLPSKLPLTVGAEYEGTDYSIKIEEYNQYIEGPEVSSGIYITAYDSASKVYTIKYYNYMLEDFIFGKLKLIAGANDTITTIELYEEDGTTLLDTLTLLVYEFHDLPTDGSDVTLHYADTLKSFYYFKAVTAGWYELKVTCGEATVYYNMSESNLNYSENVAGESAVKLDADAIVGIRFYEESDITFSAKQVEAPAGTTAENPIELDDGEYTVNNPSTTYEYYFTFTASEAGKYVVLCSLMDMEGSSNHVHYFVNGVEGGYDFENSAWFGDTSYEQPWMIVELTSGNLELKITADVIGAYWPWSLTVSVFKTYMDGTALTLESDSDYSGSLSASGAYTVSDDFEHLAELESIILHSETEFTVIKSGKTVTDTEVELTKADLAFGFYLTIDSGTVDYTANFVRGSQMNPYEMELGSDWFDGGSYVTITLPEGNYVIFLHSAENGMELTRFSFLYNGTHYGYYYDSDSDSFLPYEHTVLTLTGGKTLTIQIENENYYDSIKLSVVANYTDDATALTPNETTLDGTITASGNYKVSADDFDYDVAGIILTSEHAFTVYSATGVEEDTYETFLTWEDLAYGFKIVITEGTVTYAPYYPEGSEKNPIKITSEDLEYGYQIWSYDYYDLSTTYYEFDGEDGEYVITIVNGYMSVNDEPLEATSDDPYSEPTVTITLHKGDKIAVTGEWEAGIYIVIAHAEAD